MSDYPIKFGYTVGGKDYTANARESVSLDVLIAAGNSAESILASTKGLELWFIVPCVKALTIIKNFTDIDFEKSGFEVTDLMYGSDCYEKVLNSINLKARDEIFHAIDCMAEKISGRSSIDALVHRIIEFVNKWDDKLTDEIDLKTANKLLKKLSNVPFTEEKLLGFLENLIKRVDG